MPSLKRLSYAGRHVYQLVEDGFPNVPSETPASIAGVPFSEDGYVFKWTREEFLQVFSALLVGADTVYPEQAQRVSWLLWQYIEYPIEFELPTPQQAMNILENMLSAGLEQCEEEEEEEDMALQIQTINGRKYLVEVCCGGLTSYYQLSQVGVDGTGEPVSIEDGGTLSGDDGWGFSVGAGDASCYATNASEYMIERAREWCLAVAEAAIIGIDALDGLGSELYDIASLGAEVLLGANDIPTIQAFTDTAINNAFDDAAFRSEAAAKWTFTDTVPRNTLQTNWVNEISYFVGSFPMRLALGLWLDNSLVFGYNKELEKIAAACVGGQTGGVAGATWAHDFNWVTNNTAQGWVITDGDEQLGANGWESVDGDTDHNVGIKYPFAGTYVGNILGVRFYLDAPIQGTPSGLFRWVVIGNSVIESPNTTAQEYLLVGAAQAFDNTDELQITITTQNIGEQMLQRIQRAVIYGNGDNPFV